MTGTASYMRLIVKRIGALLGALDAPVTLVCDDTTWERDGIAGQMPDRFLGLEVKSFRQVEASPARGTTRVYFLANNDKHVYAHQMVARQDAGAGARIVSVLHDPSMFMVHRHMERSPGVDFSANDLVAATRSQLGVASDFLVRARINHWLPDDFDFSTHCMGPALAKSDEIWVHSLYGANRVRFENDFIGARCRKIKVCGHPHDTISHAQRERVGTARFTIGFFGWVTPPKRLDSVLRGLAHALERLPADMRSSVYLQVVGKRTPKSDYDPEALSLSLGLSDVVEFIDYPSTDEFEARIASSDLVFNLRYPSCGESSGTLASAGHSGVRVVCSRYQAFREAEGVWRYVGVATPYEILEISEAIIDAVKEWVIGRLDGACNNDLSAQYTATIDKLLVEEALKLLVQSK
ncbi:glycosyltransferase [Brevundimonas diminuta]|nr:glycosyltransferase [Brevundimonas diminuta]